MESRSTTWCYEKILESDYSIRYSLGIYDKKILKEFEKELIQAVKDRREKMKDKDPPSQGMDFLGHSINNLFPPD